MNEVINITHHEYGAHVDKEDNRSAIQKALNQGGDIYVPEGVFKISDSLNFKSGTRVFGEGTIKLIAKHHQAILWLRRVNDISIEGITLDGNFADKRESISGLILISDRSKKISLDNLNIINAGHFGISGANSSFIEIRQCHISRFKGRAINLTFCNDTMIEANTIDGQVDELQRGEHGIEIWGKYNQIRDSRRHVVANNTVKNVRGGGIWTATVDDIMIIGNSSENCGDVCIDVEDTKNAKIVGNVARNGKNAAIASFYASDNVWINANHAIQDRGYGPAIRIFGEGISKNIDISRNILETYDSTVIATEQGVLGNSAIFSNYIRSKIAMGIRMLEADNIRITKNVILLNQANTGIAIEGGRNCSIKDNHIQKHDSRNTSAIKETPFQGGIFLYKRDEEYDCRANQVTDNTVKGYEISINVHCTGKYQEPNLIADNEVNNIYLKGRESSIVKENSYHNLNLKAGDVVPVIY